MSEPDLAQFAAAVFRTGVLLRRWGTPDPREVQERPTCLEHMLWMLDTAILQYAGGKTEKANRWLGYVQGVMCALDYASLIELRRATKPEGEP